MKKLLLHTGFVLFCATAVLNASAQALVAITTTDQILIVPNAAIPAVTIGPFPVTGMTAGQTIAGIDFRPNTGELFALGYNSGTQDAQLYIINQTTGVASAVSGTSITLTLGTGSIGFDFNPTVDRIRVVGANGKNYRLHPETGAIVATDGDLNYAAADVNNGTSPSIGACAYTNSYIASEVTTLYNYDEELNILTTQAPPNNGTLNTVGMSGVLINPSDRTIDMDIYYDPATDMNIAYLLANIGASNTDNLYTINLGTGAVTNVGPVGIALSLKDIAAVIDRTVPPAVTGNLIYGLTKVNGNLITFDSENPSIIRDIMTVTGLTPGQRLIGMDFRPANRQLYGLGYDTVTTNYQLYNINTSTGLATALNIAGGTIALGSGNVGFDFNPTVDRIRVVGQNGGNFRLNPNDGSISATDSNLVYAVGDINSGAGTVGTVAYINSFPGAMTTTLFAIDDAREDFLNITPPNNGILNTVTPNFISLNSSDLTTDMDFFYDSVSTTNMGYLSANPVGSLNDILYTITDAGLTTTVDPIGIATQVRDIAVVLQYTGSQEGGVGLNDNSGIMFEAFPNPVTDMMTIVMPQGLKQQGMMNIRIMDMTGKILEVRTVNADQDFIQLSMESYTPGIYIAAIMNNNVQTGTIRIVKK